MTQTVRLPAAEFPPPGEGELKSLHLDEASGGPLLIVVGRAGGRLFAMESTCAHAGGDLSAGTIEGGCLVCPRHGMRYAVADGRSADPRYAQEFYPVEEDGGEIRIIVPTD